VKKALAALLSASLVLSTPWAQAQVRLPSLGDSPSEDLPVGAERRLGELPPRRRLAATPWQRSFTAPEAAA
jgi:hypothetical protein